MQCTICQGIAQSKSSDVYVFENEHWLLRHSSETNIDGYMILESRRHILDLSQATSEEIASYGPTLAMATRAINKVVAPEKVYTFTLAESCPHLHLHMIPRQKDMPRAWIGRGIMSYPLIPGVNAATLPQVCQKLRLELKRQALLG